VVKNAGIIYAQRVNSSGTNQISTMTIFNVTTVNAGATIDTFMRLLMTVREGFFWHGQTTGAGPINTFMDSV